MSRTYKNYSVNSMTCNLELKKNITFVSDFWLCENVSSRYIINSERGPAQLVKLQKKCVFNTLWNFSNVKVWRPIDGKHIRIQCPQNSGSSYFNYKYSAGKKFKFSHFGSCFTTKRFKLEI